MLDSMICRSGKALLRLLEGFWGENTLLRPFFRCDRRRLLRFRRCRRLYRCFFRLRHRFRALRRFV